MKTNLYILLILLLSFSVANAQESSTEVKVITVNEINVNKVNRANVIVLSPGPGAPKNYPISSNIYKKFKGKKITLKERKN